jgi:hypothetical protein
MPGPPSEPQQGVVFSALPRFKAGILESSELSQRSNEKPTGLRRWVFVGALAV